MTPQLSLGWDGGVAGGWGRGEEPALSLSASRGPCAWYAQLCRGANRVGPPWPVLLTWMGRGSVPSWLQRAARGRPKRAPLPAEPDGPGASAAAEVPRRAKGQGSPLLRLRVPPAVKGKQAKTPA